MNDTFTISDLMTLLTRKAGLPIASQTDDPSARFSDVGLDSLAFLEMQTELAAVYGIEMPDDRTEHYTFGEIVDVVQSQLAMPSVERAS
ncbi:acyl carrier protein [Microbacterium sp.]|uniref:acyl carrier protein n=1 Tax=Microbacterium sp. TaxID=51671 RepID=UPI002E3028CF|nr:acyl carrier protein [Microbacterium sp.]HEX5727877.1 acyl carrier protein [Microbacterium sp.]